MIICSVNPAAWAAEETHNTLRFAVRAKAIKTTPTAHERVNPAMQVRAQASTNAGTLASTHRACEYVIPTTELVQICTCVGAHILRVHGVCAWRMCMACVHGVCTWCVHADQLNDAGARAFVQTLLAPRQHHERVAIIGPQSASPPRITHARPRTCPRTQAHLLLYEGEIQALANPNPNTHSYCCTGVNYKPCEP